MDAVSRQVGGVYVTKLVNGQDNVNAYEPVPYEKQKAAMDLIINKFLANGVWTLDPAILKNLQREKKVGQSLLFGLSLWWHNQKFDHHNMRYLVHLLIRMPDLYDSS